MDKDSQQFNSEKNFIWQKSSVSPIYQAYFDRSGKFLWLNDELQTVLNASSVQTDSFFELCPTFRNILFKKGASNSVTFICDVAISKTGFAEVLKLTKVDASVWLLVFMPSEVSEVKTEKTEKLTDDLLFYIFNFITQPVFVKNYDGYYLYANKSFALMFEISNKKLLGKRDEDFVTNPEELKILKETDLKLIVLNEDIEIPDFQHVKSNGTKHSLFCLKMTYTDHEGKKFIVGLMVDKTSRKKAKLTLDQTSFELDNFIYHTSHELIAPVKTLQGLVNLAKLQPENFFNLSSIERIDKVVDNLNKYILHLVNYAYNRMENVSNEKITLKDSIESTLKRVFEYEKFNINLDFEDDFYFYSDAFRFEMLLTKILSNVFRFRKNNEIPTISVYLVFKEKDKFTIAIADKGVGISEKFVDKVFEMYFKTKDMQHGHGLGLYIAKETAKKLNGDIKIESSENVGTTVYITLPFYNKEES